MKLIKFMAIASLTMAITSCQKEDVEIQEAPGVNTQQQIPASDLAKLKAMGFNTEDVFLDFDKKGYVVEGDIVISKESLASTTVPADGAGAKARRFQNLIKCWKVQDVRIKHFLPELQARALEEAVNVWNSVQGARVKIVYVDGGQDITIYGVPSNEIGGDFSLAEFPTGNGMPGNRIRINNESTEGNGIFWKNIITHELGHCLGFVHNDETARGDNFAIPGTPDDDQYSIMNSGGYPGQIDSFYWKQGFSFWDVKAIEKVYGYNDNDNLCDN